MATFYCNSDTGNDTTGNGTIGNPYLTLSKCINSFTAAGDVAYMLNAAAPYTFSSFSAIYDCVVQGQSRDGVVVNKSADYYTPPNGRTYILKDCTLQFFGYSFRFSAPYVAVLTLQNVRIIGAPGINYAMFWDDNGGGEVNLLNCLIDDVTYPGANAGIFRASGGTRAINVFNCTFYFSGNLPGRVFTTSQEGAATLAYNFKNNIFLKGSGGSSIYFDKPNNITFDIDYNCFYNLSDNAACVAYGAHNIGADPLLVDPVNDNFNLRPGSPCISTGVLL